MKKLFAVLTLSAAVLTASAGLQPDSINSSNLVVLAAATNTYAGTVYDFSKTTDAAIEAQYVCTNANAQIALSGIVFAFDASVNQDVWVTNAVVMWVPPTIPNGICVQVTNLLAGQKYPFWRLDSVWNTNKTGTNAINLKVRAFSKTGI